MFINEKTHKNRRFDNIYKRINFETARNLNGGGCSLVSNLLERTATVEDARSSHSMWAVLL